MVGLKGMKSSDQCLLWGIVLPNTTAESMMSLVCPKRDTSIKMARNKESDCGIASAATYPTV